MAIRNLGRLNRRQFIKTTAAGGRRRRHGAALRALRARAAENTLKLGYVSPQTGPLAAFAEADEFILGQFRETVKDGLDIGGTNYAVEVVVKDSQSNPNRAAEVAKELIVDDEIDLMLVASTPETTNPVSTQCEIEEVPCISTMAPWQPWFIGRQGNPADPASWTPFKHTFHYFWGLEDVIAVFTNMWNQLETNKAVGALFPNDGDGNAWGDPNVGFPPVLAKAGGFTLVDPGRYQNLTDDFSAQITAFQNGKVEIVTGVVLPPDFTTFWTQANQKGFKPKAVSVGKAILFPVALEALGKTGNNLSSEVWWSPSASVQVVAQRPVGGRARRRLHGRDRPAVDAADRLHPLAVRVRGRHAEARRRSDGPGGDRRVDRQGRPADHHRPDQVRPGERAALRPRQPLQDAAGRRPVEAQGRRQVRHHRRRQPDRDRRCRSPARWSRSPDRRQGGALRRPARRIAR